MVHLGNITTETKNPNSKNLDSLSIKQILQLMNSEDRKVIDAVNKEIDIIEKVIQDTISALSNNGRLFFCGAGTSGRLAIIEAAECPPTFSTPPELVQGIMAGAPEAVFRAVEGSEDNPNTSIEKLKEVDFSKQDVLIGISASGRTPYVCNALKYAQELKASTALICSHCDDKSVAKFVIHIKTGPEVLTGSTRLKAATAAKLVLNMITTSTMVGMGKVYGNLMIDLSPNSEKLVDRATRIVSEITKQDYETSHKLMKEAGNAKIAILMQKKRIGKEEAKKLLKENKGKLQQLL